MALKLFHQLNYTEIKYCVIGKNTFPSLVVIFILHGEGPFFIGGIVVKHICVKIYISIMFC